MALLLVLAPCRLCDPANLLSSAPSDLSGQKIDKLRSVEANKSLMGERIKGEGA